LLGWHPFSPAGIPVFIQSCFSATESVLSNAFYLVNPVHTTSDTSYHVCDCRWGFGLEIGFIDHFNPSVPYAVHNMSI
jgi:hypothetical protein